MQFNYKFYNSYGFPVLLPFLRCSIKVTTRSYFSMLCMVHVGRVQHQRTCGQDHLIIVYVQYCAGSKCKHATYTLKMSTSLALLVRYSEKNSHFNSWFTLTPLMLVKSYWRKRKHIQTQTWETQVTKVRSEIRYPDRLWIQAQQSFSSPSKDRRL